MKPQRLLWSLAGLLLIVPGVTPRLQAQCTAVNALELRREPLGPSSRRTHWVITEIMYNPRSDERLEFVEIYNSDEITNDLSGFRLAGDIEFTFPSGTRVPARSFVLVARDPAALQAAYNLPNVPVFGPWAADPNATTNALPNDGGRVRLWHPNGEIVLQVDYDDRDPWPVAADGAGHSLVLWRPSYGEEDPRAWTASAYIGGSPGTDEPARVVDPAAKMVINEFLANTDPPTEDFVELFNYGNTEVDLSGAFLSDDPTTNKFRIPDGTLVPPRGFVAFSQSQLGFGLSSHGERIILVNSNETRVLDAVRFDAQARGGARGRYPDGAGLWSELAAPTPGTNNAALLMRPVVINEIMYHPITQDDDDEFIELYNRGTNQVDLSGWAFVDGVDFTFPEGTVLAAGQYLVVARNAAQLLGKYPQLNAQNTIGDYSGALADGGERIALAMPEITLETNGATITTNIDYVVVNEVRYGDGPDWGEWADGGGSSLELLDPRSDNRLPSNWTSSDESQKSAWTNASFTMVMDHVYPRGGAGAQMNEIQVMLLAAGEALVDDLDVHAGETGPNLVSNPDFEGGLTSWVIQGNHDQSTLEPPGPGNPSRSLHIRATGGGDNGANRVECDLTTSLTPNTVGTIGARARWLRGHPDLLLRTHGGGLEAVLTLPVPANLGSPGQPNSVAAGNAGPAIEGVRHWPVLPPANANVYVLAQVHDPDGIQSVTLRYRLDPSTSYSLAVMRDDGNCPDEIGGDGIYTGVIPQQPAGRVVAFYVEARDAQNAVSQFPVGAPQEEAVVRFGDTPVSGRFGVYRFWLTAANYNRWATREKQSNQPVPGTFVYGDYRAIYGAGARYRGSPFIRPGYDQPANRWCGYVWTVPKHELFLGEDELNLDSLEPTSRDATALREVTSFRMAEALGFPFSYQRFVHVVINGTNNASRGVPIYSDSQQPNSKYIRYWFPGRDRGDIYKIDDWFEFDDSASGPGRQQNKSASLQNFTTTGGAKKKARYRWNWEKKVNRGLNDDYSSLFALVDAVNAPDSTYVQAVESIMNVEEWLGVLAFRHIVGDWDGYGYNRGKNQFTYYPEGEKFYMLLWDLDFSLGCNGGHGPTQNLFQVSLDGDTGQNHMPMMDRMYKHPYFRRIYMRLLLRAAQGPMRDEFITPWLQERWQAFQANGVNTTSPFVGSGAQGISIPSWITQRRNYILNLVKDVEFSVTTSNMVTDHNLVRVQGTAPFLVKDITVNGAVVPVDWSFLSGDINQPVAWSAPLVMEPGTNLIQIAGVDMDGQPITATQTVEIVYTGTATPPQEAVVFNEIMYAPTNPLAAYVEIWNRSQTTSYDISGWRINGLDFTFPQGTLLTNNQIIVVVKDLPTFLSIYGNNATIAGEFAGSLDSDGETLTLIAPGATPEEDIIVDRVRYEPTPPWPTTAAGQGPSLQLIDGSTDNARASNWSDGSGWKRVTYTGPLTETNMNLLMTSAGDVYIDDIVLVAGEEPEVGVNLVQEGGFEGPFTIDEGGPWEIVGTIYTNSAPSTDFAHSGRRSLHLVGTGPGFPRVRTVLQRISGIQLGETYTLSFWYLPTTNARSVSIYFNSFFRPQADVAPGPPFSPGEPNPIAAKLPPYDPVWLNEVQPVNTGQATDNAGQTDPWVELYNAGPDPVSLDGYYLANNYTTLDQWAFPAGASLQPGEYRLVWLDAQPGQSTAEEWHANFALASTNGSVVLSRLANERLQVVDYLNYAGVADGYAYGDFPDGQPFYRQSFFFVTPGGANNASAEPIQLFINEWMADNTTTLTNTIGGGFDDWFEIYNASSKAIDLAGFYLTDNLTNRFQFQVPNGFTIPAGGFLLVWADNQDEQNDPAGGELHVNFKLSSGGEQIGLFAPDGSLVDAITFGVQTNDVSEGRWPDGSTNIVAFTIPTPGAPNQLGINTPPVLEPIGDLTVDELRLVRIALQATDAETPAERLTFSIDPGSPTNAFIWRGREFVWVPTTAHGGGRYVFTVRVTDDGQPPASSTATFAVTVREVNHRPVFGNTLPKHVHAGELLSFSTAHDIDLPAQTLAFSLEPGAPAGLTVDPNTGVVSWIPGAAQAPGDYTATVEVTDNGQPPLSNRYTYRIRVYPAGETVIVAKVQRQDQAVRLSWQATVGETYQVEYKDRLDDPWSALGPAVVADGVLMTVQNAVGADGSRFYRVVLVPQGAR